VWRNPLPLAYAKRASASLSKRSKVYTWYILVGAAGGVTAGTVMSALAVGGIAPFTALTLAGALFILSAATITGR
jgi:hypothetical protein